MITEIKFYAAPKKTRSTSESMMDILKPYKLRRTEGDREELFAMKVPTNGDDFTFVFFSDSVTYTSNAFYVDRAFAFIGPMEQGDSIILKA